MADTKAIPVPHQMREEVVQVDRFVQRMLARGCTISDTRPIYSDPLVIRQPWLVCPNGSSYSDRAFYTLFGITRFRLLLRLILRGMRYTISQLAVCYPDSAELEAHLVFLHDQELLCRAGDSCWRGPRLFAVQNIGHTLEWYVAEWFRLQQIAWYPIAVRHGVLPYRLLNMGDIDVLALLKSWMVMVECKSSTSVSLHDCGSFLLRTIYMNPDISLLLIDTADVLIIESCANRINSILTLRQEKELLKPVPSVRGLYSGATCIYVTGVMQSISASLAAVLQVHEQRFPLV